MIEAGAAAAGSSATTTHHRDNAIKRAWRGFSSLTPAHRATVIALVSLVLAGLWLRSRGMLFGTAGFWSDEAIWAIRLARGEAHDGMRPPGFMALCKLFAELFSWREFGLRLVPWVSGLLAVGVAVSLACRLFKSSTARLLFVAAIALNPGAIDLAKEFKPYSMSLLIHECGALLALLYWQTRRERWIWLAGVWSLTSVLFVQDVIFAYPAVFGVIALRALRDGPLRARVLAIAAPALTVALLLGFYFLIWRQLSGVGPKGEASQYWGGRYDVFYTGQGSHAGWLFAKQLEVAAMPGMRRLSWAEAHPLLAQIDTWVWAALHVAGLVTLLLQKRLINALLLLTPVAVALAFNALGFWPYGVFRTNLFLLVYAAAIAAAAFDWERLPGQPAWVIAALGLLLVPMAAFERDFNARKGGSGFTVHAVIPKALDAVLTLPSRKLVVDGEAVLIVDSSGWAAFDYYTQMHPDYQQRFEAIRARFSVGRSKSSKRTMQLARRNVAIGVQTWILFQNETKRSVTQRLAQNRLRPEHEELIDDGAALLLQVAHRR